MINIWIHSNIARLGDGRLTREIDDRGEEMTVGEALRNAFANDRVLLFAVIDEAGSVRRHINIFLGNENIKNLEGLETIAVGGNEISIFTAISGG